MQEGKTVVLTIDDASGGIMKKECLDAIAGQDKTIVVYVDSSASLQWVFYGKDITKETKDLDLNVVLEAVNGREYGSVRKVIKLTFADNGELPGIANFRLKSDYINSIYDLDGHLYLYYENESELDLENSDCSVIKDGSQYWVYIDLTHNSTFLLSGEELTRIIVTRLAGSNRYATAIAAANHLKEKKGIDKFESIIVASGADVPDALSASYLAYKKDGPILLVNSGTIAMVSDYINANLAPGGTVYIVGGTGAVPETLDQKINGNVQRLAGSNRYATNIEVLKEAGVEGEDLLIASGKGFADALSASAAKKPIFLVGAALTADQKSYLDTNAKTTSGKIYIIGGTGAVSQSIEDAVRSYGSIKRLAGSNRYATSIAVAEELFPETVESVVIANGKNFPDGLSGGPIATGYGAPLILVIDSTCDHAVKYFADREAFQLLIMGGTGVIADSTAGKITGGTE